MAASSRQECAVTARVMLICHGSTEAVRAAKFPADEPLDELGSKNVKALADGLPEAGRCWTSPEQRTRQTAQALGLNARIEPRLRDCDYGAWAGRTLDEVYAHQPDAASAWLRDPAAAPHGGECRAHPTDSGLARRLAATTSTHDSRYPPGGCSRSHRSYRRGSAAIVLAH